MNISTTRPQKALWVAPPTPRAVRLFRRAMGVSATEFARLLGEQARGRAYDRSTIKHLESRRRNGWRVSPRISAAFYALQKSFAPDLPVANRVVLIFSRARVPAEVHTTMRARRCRGHRYWNYFRMPHQKFCNAECKKLWREKRRKKR